MKNNPTENTLNGINFSHLNSVLGVKDSPYIKTKTPHGGCRHSAELTRTMPLLTLKPKINIFTWNV
ncbi:unnamed protein product [Schistosoma intercalatum]|nr:unnamed protein product [Schistosoma intercalatum]